MGAGGEEVGGGRKKKKKKKTCNGCIFKLENATAEKCHMPQQRPSTVK